MWCLFLGWAVAEAQSTRQRLLVGLIVPFATIGFFGDLQREVLVAAGDPDPSPGSHDADPAHVGGPLRVVAGASMWIYLTQWEVYPELEDAGHPYIAIVASLVVGVAFNAAYVIGRNIVRERFARRLA